MKTSVTNSRSSKKTAHTWRRRSCPSCKATMTSVESYDYALTHRVRHPDGKLAPFLRDRLFMDVYQSLSHRKSALEDATALTDTIILKAMADSRRGIIDQALITDATFKVLQRFDNASATYYHARHPS